MTTYPRTPRMLRGALVGLDLANPVPRVILFQYNPDALTRTLKPKSPGGDGMRAEALRLGGAPEETIKLDVEFDATDQLEGGDPLAGSLGLHPQLAALEMLIYPGTVQVIANAVLMAVGTIEVIPPTGPLTLLIWGVKRILPVRITELTITEEAYDVNLNPIRAKASIGVRVLNYDDLPLTNPGYSLFLAHQVTKEALATIGSANNISAVTGGSVSLL